MNLRDIEREMHFNTVFLYGLNTKNKEGKCYSLIKTIVITYHNYYL